MSRFSVTSAAADISLLTIEELRAACGVSGSDEDAALTALGKRISTAIARQCCIVDDGVNPPTLLQETCTEIFRWSGCGPLRLSRRPVTSITSVTVDGTLQDGSTYEISGGRNVDRLTDDVLSYWPAGKITVVYVAGFSTAPHDLKLAATKLATATYAETGRDPNLKREDIPDVREVEYWVAPSADPLLSREISDLISPYVERWI
ncbi:MAG: hypothetical protein M9944_08020 [Rhizobiaceae bacterium]|nr:hypothetical protein [Rhizobiaceae bacterium]